MKLKYKILWFEDDEDFVKRIKPGIENYLSNELGFIPNLTHTTNADDAENFLARDNYDLIITDLNLGDGKHGEKIIEKMRTDSILTEVLLYSSAGSEITRVIQENPGLERASFASGRKDLPDRLKRVIGLTVKKVQDVNNMRGLVIAEAIDVEMKIKEILLNHYHLKGNSKKIEKIKAKHLTRLNDRVTEVQTYDDKKIPEFINVLTFSDLTDSLLSLVNDIISEVNTQTNGAKPSNPIWGKKKQLNALRKELVLMQDEVIRLRNDMAHAQESQDKKGQPILKSIRPKGKDITFNHMDCVNIRKGISKHFQNIEEIAKHL